MIGFISKPSTNKNQVDIIYLNFVLENTSVCVQNDCIFILEKRLGWRISDTSSMMLQQAYHSQTRLWIVFFKHGTAMSAFNIFVFGMPQIDMPNALHWKGSSSSSPRNFITHIGITVLLLWCRLLNITTKTSFDSQISKTSTQFRLPGNYDRSRDYSRVVIVTLYLRLVKSQQKSDSQIYKSFIRTPKNTWNYVGSTCDKICLVGSYGYLTCMEELLSITDINRKN